MVLRSFPDGRIHGIQFCPHCASRLVGAVVNSEARRACSANCGFVYYDSLTPVVAAIVEHEGWWCARNKHGRDIYGLITGLLERAESPQECAVREVKKS
jgi:NADH pyrophosphatase NudC (nudix superfamily)